MNIVFENEKAMVLLNDHLDVVVLSLQKLCGVSEEEATALRYSYENVSREGETLEAFIVRVKEHDIKGITFMAKDVETFKYLHTEVGTKHGLFCGTQDFDDMIVDAGNPNVKIVKDLLKK